MPYEKFPDVYTNFDNDEIKAILSSGEVTVFHDALSAIGPSSDPDLITWENGKIRVKGDLIGNLNYAEIYAIDTLLDIAIPEQDTWYKITAFNTNGEFNDSIPDHANDHITVSETGKYIVSLAISSHSHQSNNYKYMVTTNNGTHDCENLTVTRTLPVAGAVGSATAKGICPFTVNDTVEVWALRTDGGAVLKTLTVDHINLNLILIGQ